MHNAECIIVEKFIISGQGALLLADCKGRAFTPLRQQLPARAILAPHKASYACALRKAVIADRRKNGYPRKMGIAV